jgi:hypothetical protein
VYSIQSSNKLFAIFDQMSKKNLELTLSFTLFAIASFISIRHSLRFFHNW